MNTACPKCHGPTIEGFTSRWCKAECDKKPTAPTLPRYGATLVLYYSNGLEAVREKVPSGVEPGKGFSTKTLSAAGQVDHYEILDADGRVLRGATMPALTCYPGTVIFFPSDWCRAELAVGYGLDTAQVPRATDVVTEQLRVLSEHMQKEIFKALYGAMPEEFWPSDIFTEVTLP